MSEWNAWIGREEERTDRLDPALLARFCATFDLPPVSAGPAPQGIHFCLCTPDAPSAALGEDGHPRRAEEGGGLLPPIPLPRRMWAASAITFHRPISLGDAVTRTSRVAAITPKDGASGPLVFVEIAHETHVGRAMAVEERQTLVYREAVAGHSPLTPPEDHEGPFDPAPWDAHRSVVPDTRLLFRYSALTFNTHRIHYDEPYTRDIERYRGLVVHGPLTASLLLQLAARQFGDNRLARFAFRGLSPAIVGEPLHLVMRGAGDTLALGAFAAGGRQVCAAEAVLA